jgi:hypothetical protein
MKDDEDRNRSCTAKMGAVVHGKNRTGDDAWTAFLKRPFVPHGDAKPEAEAAHTLHTSTRIEPRQIGS